MSADVLSLSSAHRRYVAIETLISATINGVFSIVVAVIVFNGSDLIDVHSIALDGVVQSFMVALMSTVVPTALTRNRVRRKAIAAYGTRRWRWWPVRLAPRAFLVALLVALIGGGGQFLVLPMLAPANWTFSTTLVYKCLYGTMVSACITPVCVLAALSDEVDR